MNLNNRKKILIFLSYYMPAYKSGGPVRSISGIVSHLSDKYQFYIVTSDRDAGDQSAFPGVTTDEWCNVGNAKVMYVKKNKLGLRRIKNIVNDLNPSLVYLNSFFSFNFSVLPLLVCLLGGGSLMVAPRGEFSRGALGIKAMKKRFFIYSYSLLLRTLNIPLYWHATNKEESENILSIIPWSSGNIEVAGNIPSPNSVDICFHSSDSGKIRIVFLSRISRIKNLHFLLSILPQVSSTVELVIAGPKSDENYWEECLELIENFPVNISVKYIGPVDNSEVSSFFGSFDLFCLPTLGENYGHAIVEAMLSGLPVLISDKTPWKGLKKHNLGWDISLETPLAYAEVIDYVAHLSAKEKRSWRDEIYQEAPEFIGVRAAVSDTKKLFKWAISDA